MLQRLEAEIRNHIRTEQQFKLYIETLQEKVEDYKAKIDDLTKV